MKLFENYNNAKQKYGADMVKVLTDQGLPPQYLWSACRFHIENNVPIGRIIPLFKDWMKYVSKYSQIDVNVKSYDEFLQLIAQGKREHLLSHILYNDNKCILYGIDSIKDARNLPNNYCIKALGKYNILKNKGYSFILVFLPQQQFPYTYVVASIHDGIVDYWDSQNYKLYNNESDNFRYEKLLPNEAKTIMHNINNNNNIK